MEQLKTTEPSEDLKVAPKDSFCDGIWVRMGGKRHYLIPALSFHSLKKLQPQLKALGDLNGIPKDEDIDNLVKITHAAMVRNYPDMKTEELEELIDMGNFTQVFFAIVTVSGLEKRTGEGARAMS